MGSSAGTPAEVPGQPLAEHWPCHRVARRKRRGSGTMAQGIGHENSRLARSREPDFRELAAGGAGWGGLVLGLFPPRLQVPEDVDDLPLTVDLRQVEVVDPAAH